MRVRSASRIMSFTRPSVVSSPALVTSMSIEPVRLIVPPNASSPTPLSTGSDSPVMFAWLMVELPVTMRPSAGMLSPGRTRTMSPGRSSLASTSTSPSSVTFCGGVGVMRMSASIEAFAPRAVRSSMSIEMSMMKAIAPDSKYMLLTKAANTASATSTFM